MTAFSHELLDDPQALVAADRGGLLRALAGAGAQVRRSVETAAEFGLDRLRDSPTPRAVLVAADAAAPYLSNLLAALASANAPVIDWRDPTLPRWVGPADALLAVSADGRHPRLAELVAQADRRGMVIAVAAPVRSPVAAAAGRHPVADVSHLDPIPPRALWWALATPALQALDALGLAPTAELLDQVADSLDQVAETDRPDSSAYTGPAKLLAAELAESVPVIAGIGQTATVAARRFAGAVQLIGGSTAMAAALPDDVARIGSLLEFAATEADFFADRVSEPAIRPRLVLIGDDDRFGEPQQSPWDGLGDDAGRRAASALAGLAASRSIGSSRILVPDAPPLVRFAAASATGDFAATYLALARGIDPCAPRLGELPH
ncbi:SIS domain-containing protein [Jatrophihabitans sp.]|uniref:SIS domain-containing protein n=1 Tax=Jatrophihabitans sp. TaxID=1932789 RepID=UPI002BCE70FF|nr:SIS domain-containing protein [Jatrophihabitans sp.]